MHDFLSSSRFDRRGVRVVTDVGRDAMDALVSLDERRSRRTAKACGPDLPTLRSSSVERSQSDGGYQAGRRGERAISRNPLRREGRTVSAYLYCSCAFAFLISHTRLRVRRASGFPCALCLSRVRLTQDSGISCRGNAGTRLLRCRPPRKRGTQYPAAHRLSTAASGILDRPIKSGDDTDQGDRDGGRAGTRIPPYVRRP
jgi:hypothetical protein